MDASFSQSTKPHPLEQGPLRLAVEDIHILAQAEDAAEHVVAVGKG